MPCQDICCAEMGGGAQPRRVLIQIYRRRAILLSENPLAPPSASSNHILVQMEALWSIFKAFAGEGALAQTSPKSCQITFLARQAKIHFFSGYNLSMVPNPWNVSFCVPGSLLFSFRKSCAMKSLMKALTQEPGLQLNFNNSAEVRATQKALGPLVADWCRRCALIRPHCAGGRCVNPARLDGDLGPRPVGYCTAPFLAAQSLSHPVGADVAQICHQQAHYPPLALFTIYSPSVATLYS